MAILMPGGPVGKALSEKTAQNAARLKEMGVTATLEVIRVGQRPEDMAYERAAVKRAQAVGVQVRHTLLPADARPEELVAALQRVNEDDAVHGCLLPDGREEPVLAVIAAVGGVGADLWELQDIALENGQRDAAFGCNLFCVQQFKFGLKDGADIIRPPVPPVLRSGPDQQGGIHAAGVRDGAVGGALEKILKCHRGLLSISPWQVFS